MTTAPGDGIMQVTVNSNGSETLVVAANIPVTTAQDFRAEFTAVVGNAFSDRASH